MQHSAVQTEHLVDLKRLCGTRREEEAWGLDVSETPWPAYVCMTSLARNSASARTLVPIVE